MGPEFESPGAHRPRANGAGTHVDDYEDYFILEPAFAGDLWDLSRTAHVWICDTPSNSGRIQAVWDAGTEGYSARSGVTSFDLGADGLETFYSYLGTLDTHHDEYSDELPWSAIHVLGVRAQEVSLERILDEVSAESVALEPRERGFTVRRTA